MHCWCKVTFWCKHGNNLGSIFEVDAVKMEIIMFFVDKLKLIFFIWSPVEDNLWKIDYRMSCLQSFHIVLCFLRYNKIFQQKLVYTRLNLVSIFHCELLEFAQVPSPIYVASESFGFKLYIIIPVFLIQWGSWNKFCFYYSFKFLKDLCRCSALLW